MPLPNGAGREDRVGTPGQSVKAGTSRPLSQSLADDNKELCWEFAERQLKHYPHFDGPISRDDAVRLATDPERVARHRFYPFLSYIKRYTRFAPKGQEGARKERPLRYAARRDAYIFMYYRWILPQSYENKLKDLGLVDVVLAYRRIPEHIEASDGSRPTRGGNKNNIHFARDAFLAIRKMATEYDTLVFAFDIESFFENRDHCKIKMDWQRLLGAKRLPEDHFRVFRASTRYAYVDYNECIRRLSLTEVKTLPNGKKIIVPKRRLPKHLCSGRVFRDKLAGVPGVIQVNETGRGVPQGCPLSDLLSNMYMLEFDSVVAKVVKRRKGLYWRYADDILIAVPDNKGRQRKVPILVAKAIRKYCVTLKIKEKKTSIHRFSFRNEHVVCQFVSGEQGQNGLEYLGFRFDGRQVYLRDRTLSGHYRKMTYRIRSAVRRWLRAHPQLTSEQVRARFPKEMVYQRFGKVTDWEERRRGYRNWTFYSYAKRAHEIMSSLGSRIADQLKRQREHFDRRVARELTRALARREEVGTQASRTVAREGEV
ncbi:MAG: reverse transcriptase domain-containing protein [Geminicoccaceae bacterium]|nr:reverse transcriptase domain-containing protein [Geminicoccaceae bacterium]MDW8369364.1 reverse transcriptase domain-containing protein [Geminicoccaceae bacterium]